MPTMRAYEFGSMDYGNAYEFRSITAHTTAQIPYKARHAMPYHDPLCAPYRRSHIDPMPTCLPSY